MVVRWKRIKGLVKTILSESNIVSPPVPVEKVVVARGVSIRANSSSDSNISGFLAIGPGQPVIGINGKHSKARRRFTMAHELGHLLLHRQEAENLHVDYGFQVKFRDDLSSQGTDIEEREANYFAAELLMPADFLEKDLMNSGSIDLTDDESEFIKNLADRYGVSKQAMIFRLANLRYITL